ncbi:response regulator [Desulfolutivibrio sulfoxidireducens]|uniref:response regulator n=1 Tax=Desulfolutivibrio sulfoxidireducens TaxID=2773299 RepID=UPI00159EB823|nr:response regulator [Desulfolutivibrio sulfoxidireducens]QLA17049.1 response regulator [Desulfolutivibrio sulfoxidireducens]QLA20617.1 response regulator [Desulfolutivibrio sulfoxidireducens]
MKFLIVDDDLAMCQILTFYLASHARCFSATNTTDALRLFTSSLRKEPFHTVFMDIEMPGFKGHDMVELFRQAEKNLNILEKDRFNLVMVSAHSDLNNINIALYTHGAKCFIKKPFTEEELINELKSSKILAE